MRMGLESTHRIKRKSSKDFKDFISIFKFIYFYKYNTDIIKLLWILKYINSILLIIDLEFLSLVALT